MRWRLQELTTWIKFAAAQNRGKTSLPSCYHQDYPKESSLAFRSIILHLQSGLKWWNWNPLKLLQDFSGITCLEIIQAHRNAWALFVLQVWSSFHCQFLIFKEDKRWGHPYLNLVSRILEVLQNWYIAFAKLPYSVKQCGIPWYDEEA